MAFVPYNGDSLRTETEALQKKGQYTFKENSVYTWKNISLNERRAVKIRKQRIKEDLRSIVISSGHSTQSA